MIRLILALLFVIVFLILSIPVFFIEFLVGKVNPQARDCSSLFIVQCAFRVVLFVSGVKTTVIGRDNIPDDQAVLYIGNHLSFFDIIIAYTQIKGLTGFISKKEVEKVPLLCTWMRLLHCLFLDRKDIKAGLKTILTAIEKVKNGVSMFIYPEGTRNRQPDTFLPFHEGSFKIAIKANCPIIPVTINNSSAVFEDHLPFIKRAHVVLEFGKPIILEDLEPENKKKIASYTQKIIEDTYFKNKELV